MMSIQMQLTLSLHYSYLRCICVYEFVKGEGWQWLFVFVVLYKLPRFMHTVSEIHIQAHSHVHGSPACICRLAHTWRCCSTSGWHNTLLLL